MGKMARQVLSNATILTDDDLEVVRGHLVIEDGLVKEISDGSPEGRATDLKGGFIIPPFINFHTHVVDSVAKELYVSKTQSQVVGPGGVKLRMLGSSSTKMMVEATQNTLQDMIRTGTLAHCDFREGGVQGVELLRKISRPPLISKILGRFSSFSELSGVLKKADGVGLPRMDAFPQAQMRRVSEATRKAKKIFGIHVAETSHERAAFIREFGKSEIDQAIDLNCSFVVHATHAEKEELLKLKEKKIPVVFCPRSNSLLGVGVPPIDLALEVGLDFFFGTDNAMLCQPDMFEEISFAWKCLRRVDTKSGPEEARKMLIAATTKPLGLFRPPWGPIAEGNKATFMVLARGHNLMHLSEVHAGLLNRARADNIRSIYLNGNNYKLRSQRNFHKVQMNFACRMREHES